MRCQFCRKLGVTAARLETDAADSRVIGWCDLKHFWASLAKAPSPPPLPSVVGVARKKTNHPDAA
jgi:hypothetical protein